MKKCVIIYNKKSGKVKPNEMINKFYSIIENYGYELDVIVTKKKGHAVTIMKELGDDIDLVIAAGGDGTFNEVIRGNILRENKLLMAHLPLGTTNDVGTMYGFSKNYEKDLELILNGVKKNIDVIMINNNPFVYVAAFGNFINANSEESDFQYKSKALFLQNLYKFLFYLGLLFFLLLGSGCLSLISGKNYLIKIFNINSQFFQK